MTLVSQILHDALRQSNLLAIGAVQTSTQTEEGLRYLNRIVKSVLGFEVGDPLTGFPLGGDNISRPSGFPSWGNDPGTSWTVPKNSRLALNLTQSVTLYLNPAPQDGERFAVNDHAGNLATFPVTVQGNGRLIEDATSVTLDTDGLDAEWFFRADTGNWVRVSALLEDDVFPFPEEFDDFFITMTAARLNPSYGAALDPQSQMMLTRARSQLRARYRQNHSVCSTPALTKMPLTVVGREYSAENQPNFGDAPR